MCELMSLQICTLREIFATNITLIWLLTCVGNTMLIQDFISSKFPPTYVTFVCLHPQMTQRVNSESSTQRKLFVTNVTLMTLTFGMYMAVTLQMQTSYKSHLYGFSNLWQQGAFGVSLWVEMVLQISHLSAFFWVWLSYSELKSSEWPISKQAVLSVPHSHLFWCCSLQSTINTFVTVPWSWLTQW